MHGNYNDDDDDDGDAAAVGQVRLFAWQRFSWLATVAECLSMIVLCCTAPLLLGCLRLRVRKASAIPGSMAGDLCCSLCCPCCSLAQMARHTLTSPDAL